MKILGVDLGSYSIKVAELDVTGKGYVLSGFYEFTLSLDPQRDRGLEIIETLRNFSSKYDPSQTKWVLGITQNKVSVHYKRFPFRERAKVLKSLAFELEDEIPFDIDETIFDAKIIEFVGTFADVLTIACPSESVEEALNLAKDGGFEPEIVSVEGLALSNLFENWNAVPREGNPNAIPVGGNSNLDNTVPAATIATTTMFVSDYGKARLVLQMGHSRCNLLVYREGALIAVRSILWGGGEVAEALSSVFKTSLFEGVKTLQTKSFILMNSAGASRDQLLLSKTISDSLDVLIREMRLTLLEVRAAFQVEFQQLDLIGGVSQLQNIGAYITQALEIPTNTVHTFQALPQVRIEVSPHIEAVSSVAIGLAIEGLKRPRNPATNLRKGEFARENESLKQFWATWRVPIQVAATAFVLLCVYSFVRDTIAMSLVTTADERVSEVAKNEAGLKGATASDNGLRTFINARKKVVKDSESLLQAEKYTSALEILAQLAQKLPVEIPPKAGQGVDIVHLNIENNVLTIEGRVQGGGGKSQVERALSEVSKNAKFSAVAPNQPITGPGTAFAYKVDLNRKP